MNDNRGYLYGTTWEAGTIGWGNVWRVSQNGTHYNVLHNFANDSTDGANPRSGVILDEKGNLYGDTLTGGTYSSGTVYELNKNGLILLHSFNGTTDGQFVSAPVILDASGNLYGTTVSGGTYTTGTVWELNP